MKEFLMFVIFIMPFIKFVFGIYEDGRKDSEKLGRSIWAGLLSMALTYTVFYFAGLFEYAATL